MTSIIQGICLLFFLEPVAFKTVNSNVKMLARWSRHRENREFGSYVFPDRENTGNFVVTQGKFLRHRENIIDYIHQCKKHDFLHIFSK